MKKFKFLVAALLFIGISFTSCEYDDSEIWSQMEELMVRVQKLETVCEQHNSNIVALQTLLNGIKDNVYVTSVTEIGDAKGYYLEFSNAEKVAIYHGENGRDGEIPSLNIVKVGDAYCWSVNGEVLKDEAGNAIVAGGSEGASPILKTGSQLDLEGIDGTWDKDAIYVSSDKTTWIKVVTGGTTQIFTSVEVSENNQMVNITLSDGSVISIPKTDKILAMLYGKWERNLKWDDQNVIVTFNEDNSFVFNADKNDYSGTFRFIPDRYIECVGRDHYDGEDYNSVFTIIEIKENTLTLDGDSFTKGSFTRISDSQNSNNNNNSSNNHGNGGNAGGGIVVVE